MSEPKTYTGEAKTDEASVKLASALDDLVKRAMDAALIEVASDDEQPNVPKRIMPSARATQKQFNGTFVVRLSMGSGSLKVSRRTSQPERVQARITYSEPLNPGNAVANDLLTKARGHAEAMRKMILGQQAADLAKSKVQDKPVEVPGEQPVRVIVELTTKN
ncbi:hypothetical protein KSX_74290 [Ktedonospora formicarum]|uniref:Uncharacterized protein n=2 Tax=Ktedonospora formicarum TaxID=2778364 RepID=A0A8J3I600_9CHLR|nr:hypothetical protein KSX_74290 [Ktedonospora formicarum]